MDGSTTRVALIAAGAAIVGALIGALVPYFVMRSLDDRHDRYLARGVARVYQSEFGHFDGRLAPMVLGHKWIPSRLAASFTITTADKELLAPEMSTSDWETVEKAEARLQVFDANFPIPERRLKSGQHLSRSVVKYVRSALGQADDAIVALDRAASDTLGQKKRKKKTWAKTSSRLEPYIRQKRQSGGVAVLLALA